MKGINQSECNQMESYENEGKANTMNYRLYNMDCLEFMKSDCFRDQVDRNNVIIVTDPPFNIGYHYATYKDRMKEEQYYSFLKSVLTMYRLPFVLIHYPETLYRLSAYIGVFPEKVVSWVYNSNTARQHRDIAFFGVKPDFRQVRQPYKNPNDKRIRERIARGLTGARLYDWWNVNQEKNVTKNKDGIHHPCVMPSEVMENIVGILPGNSVIFDPFMGSGTTGVACGKRGGRIFIGTEIDKEYYAEAEKRIKAAYDESQTLKKGNRI